MSIICTNDSILNGSIECNSVFGAHISFYVILAFATCTQKNLPTATATATTTRITPTCYSWTDSYPATELASVHPRNPYKLKTSGEPQKASSFSPLGSRTSTKQCSSHASAFAMVSFHSSCNSFRLLLRSRASICKQCLIPKPFSKAQKSCFEGMRLLSLGGHLTGDLSSHRLRYCTIQTSKKMRKQC